MKTQAIKLMLILLPAVMVVLISCNSDKAPGKGNTGRPTEQPGTSEVYRKGLEDSKKVVVAKVNGVNISSYDLLTEINALAPTLIQPGQKRTPELDQKVRQEALDRLIYRELALQEAERQGLKVLPNEVEEELRNIRSSVTSDEAYRENLMARGLTEEGLKKNIEKSILIAMITEKEIFAKTEIDPKQVKKTYEKKKSSYKGPSGLMSFEEARPIIEQELMTPLVQKREDEWVEELKKAARIEILQTR